MTEATFSDFVRGALSALAAEVPRAYTSMVEILGGREVLLCVDGEGLSICFAASDGPVLARPRNPVVRLETGKSVIVRLAGGGTTLLDAILSDEIRLCGDVQDFLAFHDALMAYLHGAVRSPSSPARLARFQRFTVRHSAHEELR